MELAMTMTDGPTGLTQTVDPEPQPPAGGREACRLAAEASQPGVDPCDVACEAMPGHCCGDLTTADEVWLRKHTAVCSYCANMLHSYEKVDSVLERLQDALTPVGAPPAWKPERERRRAGYARLDSPIGPLLVAATEQGVCEIGFAFREAEDAFRQRLVERGFAPVHDESVVQRVGPQLQEYFSGKRDRFDLPLDLSGVSPFTRSVLTATAEVPFGHLTTYREIAERTGRPSATRAVGNALGRNPIPVIVPCHRVVRSDGSLGGYTGGLWIKERLLSIEGRAPR